MSLRKSDVSEARSQVWRKGLVACLVLGLGGVGRRGPAVQPRTQKF
jgi:hypothetical protein